MCFSKSSLFLPYKRIIRGEISVYSHSRGSTRGKSIPRLLGYKAKDLLQGQCVRLRQYVDAGVRWGALGGN